MNKFKLLIVNFIILIIFFLILYSVLIFLNIILGGNPVYSRMGIGLETVVNFYKNNDEVDKIDLNKKYILKKCGNIENGKTHLAYYQDKNGFRENSNNSYENVDIVILGDSFGFSQCVNKPNDFSTQLQNYTSEKILNLSVPGSGPLWQSLILQKYVKKTNFKTLVWIFYEGNDYQDLVEEPEKDLKLNFVKKSKYLNADDFYINKKLDYNFLLLLKIWLAEKLSGLNTLIKYFVLKPIVTDINNYEKIISKTSNFLERKEIENKYIFFIPSYTKIAINNKSHPEFQKFEKEKEKIIKIAKKYNFKFIDFHNSRIFNDKDKKLNVFHYDLPTHFNKYGYEEMAKYLSKNLD